MVAAANKQHNTFVAYSRVSTVKQGESGLGLEAQRFAVQDFMVRNGGEMVREFVEIESGRKANRPELVLALDYCRKHRATLLIAKLDRLARNVHFISGLMEAGVNFTALDMPQADRFMLHVYAAMAEEEARRISQRTKGALQAAKARGVTLGANAKRLSKERRAAADKFAQRIGPRLLELKCAGQSVRSIAGILNQEKVPAFAGGRWHPTAVARVSSRYQRLDALVA
jgi:DNA invertase Pin-like site-specific DNA recombinase